MHAPGVYYGSSGHSIPLVQVTPSDGQVSGSTVETPEPAHSQPRKYSAQEGSLLEEQGEMLGL